MFVHLKEIVKVVRPLELSLFGANRPLTKVEFVGVVIGSWRNCVLLS